MKLHCLALERITDEAAIACFNSTSETIAIPDETAMALRQKEYLMKLHRLALEGIPDEAALASFRRNQGNAGFRDQSWIQCCLLFLVFGVSFFNFLRDENDSAEKTRIFNRKAK